MPLQSSIKTSSQKEPKSLGFMQGRGCRSRAVPLLTDVFGNSLSNVSNHRISKALKWPQKPEIYKQIATR